MESYVNKGHFLGSSILVALENNIIHQHFCGFRDKANTKPFDINTVIRIYSMTKPITALALMILQDQKKLDINSPISEFIPSFSNPTALIENASSINQVRKVSPPTLSELLSHTSGLSYSFNDSLIGRAYGEAIKVREKSELSHDNLKRGKNKVTLNLERVRLHKVCEKDLKCIVNLYHQKTTYKALMNNILYLKNNYQQNLFLIFF